MLHSSQFEVVEESPANQCFLYNFVRLYFYAVVHIWASDDTDSG